MPPSATAFPRRRPPARVRIPAERFITCTQPANGSLGHNPRSKLRPLQTSATAHHFDDVQPHAGLHHLQRRRHRLQHVHQHHPDRHTDRGHAILRHHRRVSTFGLWWMRVVPYPYPFKQTRIHIQLRPTYAGWLRHHHHHCLHSAADTDAHAGTDAGAHRTGDVSGLFRCMTYMLPACHVNQSTQHSCSVNITGQRRLARAGRPARRACKASQPPRRSSQGGRGWGALSL